MGVGMGVGMGVYPDLPALETDPQPDGHTFSVRRTLETKSFRATAYKVLLDSHTLFYIYTARDFPHLSSCQEVSDGL